MDLHNTGVSPHLSTAKRYPVGGTLFASMENCMIRAIIAFVASLGVGVQAYLMFIGGKGICLDDGCAIVEQLTRVPPLYFNIAGLLFFQALFWLFLWGHKGAGHWHRLARLLLLAGLVAEAVLLFFQYAIAGSFCSYCLAVFAAVVLLNLLSGPRQIFRGTVLFVAVLLTLFSLRFTGGPAGGSALTLAAGTIAVLPGEEGRPTLHLFFSAACPHCEKVIETLQEENFCPVRFNPVEPVPGFSFPGATFLPEYQPEVNLSLLKTLAIGDIPTLIADEAGQTLVLRGEQRIQKYLAANCRRPKAVDQYHGSSSAVPAGSSFTLPFLGGGSDQDACGLAVDCPEEEAPEADSAAGNRE